MLTAGIVGAAALVLVLLALAADRIVVWIPFSVETSIASHFDGGAPESKAPDPYLESLSARIAAAMDLPEEISIRVHALDGDGVNAFATLGGHVVVLGGLLDRVESENELAMVLAHEIAHVKHRHPIRAMGRGVVLVLALVAVAGGTGSDLASQLIGDVGNVALLGFSRAQEREADIDALAAVQRLYGHTRGALRFYERILAGDGGGGRPMEPPAFLSTHPLTRDRISSLEALRSIQRWPATGPLTDLPAQWPPAHDGRPSR